MLASRRRWRWLPAALLVPPLVTLGLPGAGAQTTEASDAALIAAGDIAMCQTTGDEETATLIDSIPGTVLALGDLAYEDGSKADFDNCYAPTLGPVQGPDQARPRQPRVRAEGRRARTSSTGAPVAGDPRGYYSFDLGPWHVIALNSNCSDVGGCSKGSPMEQWLREDLAAHPADCILAFWHHPRFFSPSKQPTTSKLEATDKKMQAFWADLYAAGADVVAQRAPPHLRALRPPEPRRRRPTPTGSASSWSGRAAAPTTASRGPSPPTARSARPTPTACCR